MDLGFNENQIQTLRERGILSYISGEEYNTSGLDGIRIDENIYLKVHVESLGEITRYRSIRQYQPTSGYDLMTFGLQATQYRPPYMHLVTLVETVDTTPKQSGYMPLEDEEKLLAQGEAQSEPKKRGRRRKEP